MLKKLPSLHKQFATLGTLDKRSRFNRGKYVEQLSQADGEVAPNVSLAVCGNNF